MKGVISLLLLFCAVSFAQENQNHEVSSEVKELSDFHEVIYQLWHTAWPEKNVEMLKSLLPEVEEGFTKIKNAELPGILRDKKTKWNEGVIKLEETVKNYKDAFEKNDSAVLLNAAEKLHMQYEGLVRVIKPVLKEVDAFHQVLYMVYHYYMPEYNFEKIKSSAVEMKLKMEELNKAQLSQKQKPKEEKFNSARKELDDAVLALNEISDNDGKEKVTAAVNKVHTKYEELEKVFE
ncbi:MAG: hypothetical protein AB1521_16280 [Bacteroidota bacterium]